MSTLKDFQRVVAHRVIRGKLFYWLVLIPPHYLTIVGGCFVFTRNKILAGNKEWEKFAV